MCLIAGSSLPNFKCACACVCVGGVCVWACKSSRGLMVQLTANEATCQRHATMEHGYSSVRMGTLLCQMRKAQSTVKHCPAMSTKPS